MKTGIYAIMDRQMNAFMAPAAIPTDGMAIRQFIDKINGQNPMSQHPDDYSLWRLGYFDDQTGEMINEKEKLGEAANFVKKQL